jgi:hypothetical protein
MNETFGWALKQLQNGTTVRRAVWSGDSWLSLKDGVIEYNSGLPVSEWLPDQESILAIDWTVTD